MIIDGLGSSEAGGQGSQISNRQTGASTGKFVPGPDNVVVDEAMTQVLAPGHEGMGWWAKRGYVPLGYLDDAAKTERTFVMIGDTRFAVPGDRARHLADGSIELHGRDSVTINSGGEKIFAEEVEHALKHHPAVYDAVVAGRPERTLGAGGGGGGAVARRRFDGPMPIWPKSARNTSRATNCRKPTSIAMRSCAAPAAKPIIAGQKSRPSRLPNK